MTYRTIRDVIKRIKIVGGTKTVKLDKLFAVEPTHVIVNIDETPKQLAEAIAAEGARVIVTHPIEAGDNLDLYRLIGGIFGRTEAAGELCAQFEAAHGRVVAAATTLPRRRVLYLIWQDPWMTVSRDTYISRLLDLVNWRTVGHDPEMRYPEIEIDTGLLRETDIILFSTEPFTFTEAHVEEFRARYGAAGPRLALFDGEYGSWYGTRAIRALDYLAEFAASA